MPKSAANRPTKKDQEFIPPGPASYAARWPTDLLPLAMFGVNGTKTILATAVQQIRPKDFFAKPWSDLKENQETKPRWIGLLPYDEFCAFAERKLPTFIYEIHEALVWENGADTPSKIVSGDPKKCALKLDAPILKEIEKDIAKNPLPDTIGTRVLATMSDETYLGQVQDILAEIRRGTFYQLNLLRYFRLEKQWKWSQVCARVAAHGGPMSSLFRHGNTAVASFSPERFVAIQTDATIHTWPIKGTIARNLTDTKKDEAAKAELLASEKDRAELHMIVDLMRNDLQQVCLPTTVEVPTPHAVKTFQHVHHLESHVTGKLKPDITMGELFAALAPGGSITGAPKREVMKHIRSLEGRERGYIMGNAFVIYSDGSMDSSILIRTMVSNDGTKTWEYAAGSGLVIKSDAQQELQEVFAKCRPITD